jgi:hypothetical protein
VRGGRIRGQRGWVLEKVEETTTATLVEHFLGQVYGESAPDSVNAGIPREVLVPELPPDVDTMTQWLSERRGGPVALRVPQRGDKKTLAQTVERNAKEALALHKTRRASDLTTRSQALHEIQEALGLDDAPLRIECYDVSNLQGTNVVASMVVFEDGLARKSEYRRFSIRGYDGSDDISAIREVITRRFRRYLAEREETGELDVLGDPAAGEDQNHFSERVVATAKKFAYPPNLVVVDGARGQRRGGRLGAGRAWDRRCRRVRPGQAAGRGVAARRGVPGNLVAHQRGPVPAAARAGRGAPVRDHVSQAEAGQGRDRVSAGRHPGSWARAADGAAEEVRLGEGAVGGVRRGDSDRAWDRPAAGGNDHGRAARRG